MYLKFTCLIKIEESGPVLCYHNRQKKEDFELSENEKFVKVNVYKNFI